MAVAALAGRRIDSEGTSPARFPTSSIARVRAELENILRTEAVHLLICAAASGADLLALDVAQRLKIRCRVILPFDASRFRVTSVVDRSEEWGPLFDTIIAKISASGGLVIVDGDQTDEEAYQFTTNVIVDEARKAAAPEVAVAILVWDGESSGLTDYTDQFRKLVHDAGMRERVILTR